MITSKCPNDANFDAHLDSPGIPPPLAAVIRFNQEFLGDEVEANFAHPQLGLKGRISGQGLSLIGRTAAKYLK
jgi:hypothetical protein